MASLCANEQGVDYFWKMHDAFFLDKKELGDKKIIELQEFQKEGGENDVLEEVMSYYRLKKVLSAKLNRVV